MGGRAEVVLSMSVEESMSSDILVWKSEVDLICVLRLRSTENHEFINHQALIDAVIASGFERLQGSVCSLFHLYSS